MSPLRLAKLSLRRRESSSVIVILAIALSVATSGLLLRLYMLSGARFSTLADGGDAVVGAKAGGIEILLNALNSEGPYPDYLPIKLYESLRQQQTLQFEDGAQSTPGYMEKVIPIVLFGRYSGLRLAGTDEGFLSRPSNSPQIARGRFPQGIGEVLLGSDVALKSNLTLDESLTAKSWVGNESRENDIPLKVVGILAPTRSVWDRMLFSTLEEAQAVLEKESLTQKSIWGPKVLNYFLVYLKPGGFVPLQNLINKRTVGQVIRVEDEKEKLMELTGSGRRLGLLMSIFILLLGGLAVSAMLIARFDGMNIQMAVLRALGFGKSQITLWLIWEGLLLGSIACVLGALLDACAFPLTRALLGSALPPKELVSSHLYLSCPVWIAAMVATVLAVVFPLFRLFRQNVHLALKGL